MYRVIHSLSVSSTFVFLKKDKKKKSKKWAMFAAFNCNLQLSTRRRRRRRRPALSILLSYLLPNGGMNLSTFNVFASSSAGLEIERERERRWWWYSRRRYYSISLDSLLAVIKASRRCWDKLTLTSNCTQQNKG